MKLIFSGLLIALFCLSCNQIVEAPSLPNPIVASERFKDQVILVTGGTSGIGLATAVQFAINGAAHVIVCGRNGSKWESAQDYIAKHLPGRMEVIEYWPCDVRVEAQVKEMIQKIFDRYQRLDVCFNNAGVQPASDTVRGDITQMNFGSAVDPDGSILFRMSAPQPSSPCLEESTCATCDPSETSSISPFCESPLATNIFGIFYCMKWELHYAFKNHPKHLPFAIISTSSRNGVIPDPHRPLYAGSKAFIINLTHCLSNQAAQRSIKEGRAMVRVNVISPGPVNTPLERAAFPGDYSQFAKEASVGVPMQRVAEPEEIAPSVLFLADGNSSGYITGANLPIDGGNIASPLITCH